MSNGEVCCILGVCCPPESGAQEAALTHEIVKDLDCDEPEARKIAKWIITKFDLAPAGTLAPLTMAIAEQARAHPPHGA